MEWAIVGFVFLAFLASLMMADLDKQYQAGSRRGRRRDDGGDGGVSLGHTSGNAGCDTDSGSCGGDGGGGGGD
jgi:hypothetical protein